MKLMEGSTLFSCSAISSILMFSGWKITISSIYLKYVVLLVSLFLKKLASKILERDRLIFRWVDFQSGGHIFSSRICC